MAKKRNVKNVRDVLKRVEIINLKNLRPEHDVDGRLVFKAVARAEKIDGEGWEPVSEVDGEPVLAGEAQLKIGSQEFPTRGRVRGVIACPDGSLVVDDGSGSHRRFERGDNRQWIDLGPEPEWPPVTITAKRHSVVEMTLAGMHFESLPSTGAVSDDGTLTRLAGMLSSAYSSAAGVARQRGVLIRPVIARATIFDRDGATLYRGPEVLVGTECLGQYSDTVNLPLGGDGQSVSETKIELTAYKLHIKVNPMTCQGWVERAAMLVVEVSPQFHPWVAESGGRRVISASVGRGTGQAGERRLTLSVPGAAMSLGPSRPERSTTLIEAMVSRFEKVKRVAARFQKPYERGVDEEITVAPYVGLAEEVAEATRDFSDRVLNDGTEDGLGMMNAPNRFSARIYASDGTGTILAGDVEVNRFKGHVAAELAAAVDPSRSYKSVTSVIFRDGSVVSRVESGQCDAPTVLSPLVSYPSPDAVGLRIGVEYSDGSVQRWSYSLHPDPAGRISVGVDPTIAPVAGAVYDEPGGLPTDGSEDLIVRMKNRLAVVSACRPGVITAIARTEGSIKAIAGARTGGGSWEFGRSRFVVGTDRGMILGGVNERRDKLVLNHLNDRITSGRFGMTSDSDGVIYVIERGRVFRVSGSRTEELEAFATRSTDLDTIAFDNVSRCVVIGSSNGGAGFHYIDINEKMPTFVTPSLGPFGSLTAFSGKIYVATESGLYVLGGVEDSAKDLQTDISITARLESIDRDRAIRRVEWPVLIDEFDGEMKVERFFMSPYPQALLTGWLFTGSVHTTLRFPVIARSVTACYATITGRVGLGPGNRAIVGMPE